jgi:tripartite-type tricarboxylate transporter receptor subunit TctC
VAIRKDPGGDMNRRTVLLTTAIAGVLSAFGQYSSSQPIRLIVPAAPGGAIEPYARLISEHMAKTLGHVVIVENKPGANGNIAAQFVLNSPSDGTSILIATQSLIEINPGAYVNLKWSLDDFIVLIRGVVAPLVFVTHPSVPAQTFEDVIVWIKSNPGKLSYSSYSSGTPSHLLGFLMNERFGLDLGHVPYRGSGPQVIDLVSGHALLGLTQMQSALPHLDARNLNAIATTGKTRSAFLRNVPTFADLGYPEFTANIWFGLMIRAGTPPAVVAKLLDAAKSAHADQEVRIRLQAQGFDLSGQVDPDLSLEIRSQIQRWGRLIRATSFDAEVNQ